MMKIPKLLAGGAIALASIVVATPPSAPVAAAGTPDVVLTKTMPDEVLYGAPGAGGPVPNATVIPVTLTLENPTTDDGFNASFTDVLPVDVSYVPGSSNPEPQQIVRGDGTTVLVWSNVADSLAGTTVTIDFEIAADTTAFDLVTIDTVANAANAYVNSNARFVPQFDPVTGDVIPTSATGNDSDSAQTELIPFELTKVQPETESELLRGVHDHQTIYTLRIDNNFVNQTTNFEIVDYIPATMEFLGCGTVDNTTYPVPGDEYPTSGVINPGNAPTLVNPCPSPSAVETVTEDPDGPGGLPNAVYTKVTWDVASLATDLAAGAFIEFDYVAAIPLRENVDDGSTADPTANLDNNTGALTTEVASGAIPEGENEARNYAEAAGDYNDAVPSTDDDVAIVSIEDVSIHKAGPDTNFVQGDTPTFTLTIESSEYTTSTGPITVTDTIPAALDLTSATPTPTSGPILNADGSHTYTWIRPAFTAPSSSDTITLNTLVREFYRDGATGGNSSEPVAANQSYTNVTDLITDATIINDNDGSTITQSVVDESSASQSSLGPTILKEVSEPISSGTLTCGDGSASSPTYNPTFASSYRPGDRVCFRLNVDFPANLDTNDAVVQDFLPAGFTYESFQYGDQNNIPTAGIVFAPPVPPDSELLSWALPDTVDEGTKFQVVISTIVNDPLAAAAGDILENLQKVRYTDGGTGVFQLRDQALAEWSEPSVGLSKGVITVNTVAVPGAPADGVAVEQSDVVRYQIDLVNSGSEPALDVSVRDILPPGITCADVIALSISNGGECDLANDWIQWDPADDIDLAASGGTAALTYDVTVPTDISAGLTLVNTAGVRQYSGETNTGTPFTYVPGNNIDPTLTPNTDPADDTSSIITAEPSIVKSRDTSINSAADGNENGEATIGETISYSITVTLPDNLTYYDGEITDVVDAEKDLDATSVEASLDGVNPLPAGFDLIVNDATNSITVDFPASYTVPDGDDQVLLIEFDAVVLDVPANLRDTGTPNTATFRYDDSLMNPRTFSDGAGTRIVEPNIVLGKANSAVGAVSAGQAVDFTLTLTNDDTPARVSSGYDTVVVDTLPDDLIVLDAPGGSPVADTGTVGPDGGVWNAGDRTITWNVGTVQPGQTITLDYQVQVDDPLIAAGVLTNTANATTTSMPGDVTGERTSSSPQGGAGSGYQDPAQSSVSVPIFSLTKDATPTVVTVGETVAYEIDVTIPAGVIAYDTTVIDQVPPGIVFDSLSAVACDQGGAACVPAVGTGDVSVIPATGAVSGTDIAFFFDDVFDTASSAERVVTITYTGYVADDANADSGATLTNTAAVYWNNSDTIPPVPPTTPVPGDFDSSSPTDDAEVDTVEPTLVIDKNVNDEDPSIDDSRRAKPGDVLTYTVDVTNTGTSAAYDATVIDVATDQTWAFADTTTAPGVTNTDADPVGGLEWTIDGPIAVNATVTISYTLTVPADYDEVNENPTGPEQVNTADVPSYFGVEDRTVNPTRYREYDDVTPDSVSIELDLASIGDYVWFDVNGDGVQGAPADEPPLAGVPVTVTYFGPDNVLGGGDDEVYPTVTQPDGSYLVESLPGGQYQVEVDDTALVAAGFVPSYDLDGTTVSPNSLWSGPLAEDEAKRDVDFGYTGTGSIGDTLWFDQNLNGVKDANEAGLGGIEVQVTWYGPDDDPGGTDNVVYTTTTASAGTYLVENLPAGGYDVAVTGTLPPGYVNVYDPDGGTPNQSSLVLGAGADNLDQDFGYAGVGSIGDTIYLDQDGDGTQDPGEPGLEGVMVQLISFGPDGVLGGPDDSTFMTTTTTDGAYLFPNLPLGEYQVTVTGGLPANVDNTGDPDGPTPIGDSTSRVALTAGAPSNDLQDFGYDANSVLGDRVWWDLNRDGVQDAGEPGINGVQITATGPNGLVLTTTTSGDGDYLFVDIPDGAWTVTVGPGVPPGFDQTYDATAPTNDGQSTTNLVTEDLLQDFGYAGNSSIGDRLWLDRNRDGVQDAGEPGIEMVDVELTWFGPDGVLGGGDDVIFVDETGADGDYGFDGLPAGEFSVRVIDTDPDFPAGVSITYDRDGGIVSPDGITPVTLGANEDIDDVDFGYAGGGAIGDTVWFDRNDNGLLDGDEVGLSGVEVTVTWLGEDNTPGGGDDETFVVTTGTDGTYLVDGLPSGVFDVTVTNGVPAGMVPTFDADGGLDETSRVTLGSDEINLDQDFGYRGTGSIGDTVYLDLDGDGAQGPDEPGVPDQTIELTWPGPGGPETFTTTTGSDGSYLFENLPPAAYTVTVVDGIVPLAENVTDPDGGGDSTSALTLGDGENNLIQDFGYRGNNAIGDTVWHDVNADGVDDAGEPRLEGVEVTVVWFGPDGAAGGADDVTLAPTTTNSGGNYLVGNLPDGSYSVTVTGGLPSGLDVNTFDGDDGATNPDGTSVVTDLGVGTIDPAVDLDQDFGYTGVGSIGDTIWLDLDGDGVLDAGEPGIPAATVTLLGAGADGVLDTADDVAYGTQITGTDGTYLFENLPAGPFRVSVADLPAGVSNTADPDGGADDTSETTLAPAGEDLDQDFGYNGSASVGDTIWLDVDGDGTQDPNEPGIPGVTVTVVSPGLDGVPGTADDLIIETQTDADGRYLVEGLPPGTTVVSYDPSDLGAGLVPDSDLDGGDVTTATVTLANGDDVRNVDFGVVGDASLTGSVFLDLDTDGVRDPSEDGIPDVTVEITWDGPDGPVVLTVVTDSDGRWSLDDIPSGDYTVRVLEDTVPDGLIATTPNDVTVTVPLGGTNNVDNGYVPAGSIGDRVWFDQNNNGVQDPGEPGVGGVTVRLLDEDGTVISTRVTDNDGIYVFADLPPGVYRVVLDPTTLPSGVTIVFDRDGNPNGRTTVTLEPGQEIDDVDFGIINTADLPATGGNGVGTVLLTGLGLLLAGLALLLVRRRRNDLRVTVS